MKWLSRKRNAGGGERPALIHALDGFLNAGSAPRLVAQQLSRGTGEVVYSFDVDDWYDYRARRPSMTFREDHYQDYEEPRLDVVLERDQTGKPYLVLAGPEPDFHWESFVDEVRDVVDEFDVSITVGLGSVPMGIPHTRPTMITMHGTKPELIDRKNLWTPEVTVPSSAQSLLEYRLGQHDYDAIGYVVHVPHYLAQIEYPTAAVALLDVVTDRLELSIDSNSLRESQGPAMEQIEQQISEQGSSDVLHGLEQQYDAFTRGAAQSLLVSEEDLPSGDELAQQFEQFLARRAKDDESDQ